MTFGLVFPVFFLLIPEPPPVTTTLSTTTTTRRPTTTTTKRPPRTTTARPTPPDGGGSGSSGGSGGPQIQSLGPICRGAYEFLNCPRGTEIRILNVFYGRRDGTTCVGIRASRTTKTCSLTGAASYVRPRCDGRTGCWIFHGLFTLDPCPQTDKYANIIYKCSDII